MVDTKVGRICDAEVLLRDWNQESVLKAWMALNKNTLLAG